MDILKIIIILCATCVALDINTAKGISDYCKVSIDGDRMGREHAEWCDLFIENELYFLTKENEYCLDTAWTADRWNSAFLVESLFHAEKSPKEVLRIILNRKHTCPKEVI